jgi:signal transduction histidine kinase
LPSQAFLTIRSALDQPEQLSPLPVSSWSPPESDTLPYRSNVSLYNNAYERVFTMHAEAPPVSVKTLQEIQKSGELRFSLFNLHALGLPFEQSTGNNFTVIVEGYCDPQGGFQLRNILIGSFLLGMTAFALLSWFLAGQALEPVSRIINEVNAIQPANLDQRLQTVRGKDELSRLSATFNGMLDRVEHAFRMQRMFLSNVSHELRNPLTAMRMQIDVALQRHRQPEEYRRALESLLEDLRQMSDVEEKLLMLAKMLNDPTAIPFAPIRLDELLWQTRELVQKRNDNYKIHLEYENMPELEDSLFIQANEALLRTALLNLCENGCKYSPDHQAVLRLKCCPEGRHIVEVCDQGTGIAEEELPLIFEPFFRSPRHRNIRGAGIGLSLVQSILNIHKIRLQVENIPQGGAVFRLYFP